MKSAEAPVRRTRHVEFSALDFVQPLHLIEEIGKDAITASLKKQIVAGRRGTHNNVAASLGFMPIPFKHVVDALQSLAAAGECQYARISAGSIVVARQND